MVQSISGRASPSKKKPTERSQSGYSLRLRLRLALSVYEDAPAMIDRAQENILEIADPLRLQFILQPEAVLAGLLQILILYRAVYNKRNRQGVESILRRERHRKLLSNRRGLLHGGAARPAAKGRLLL